MAGWPGSAAQGALLLVVPEPGGDAPILAQAPAHLPREVQGIAAAAEGGAGSSQRTDKASDAPALQSPFHGMTADLLTMTELVPEVAQASPIDLPGRTPEAGPGAGAPAPMSDLGRSVAMQLAAAVSLDGDGGYEIRLSPEELGVVKLTLQVTDGAVTLAIQAERPETLELMRRNIDILERELRDAGFTSLNLSFGHGGGDRQPQAAAPYGATLLDRTSATGTVPYPPAPQGRGPSSSQLDLRL